MLLNCGVGEDSWQSLGLQGDPTSPLRNQSWIFIGRTVAEAETPILWPPDANSWLIWKYPDAGKDWRQEEKRTTAWDGWMASLTRWTWVWVNSGSWWWTGRSGVLQSMGLQRVGHDWVTELAYQVLCQVVRYITVTQIYSLETDIKQQINIWVKIMKSCKKEKNIVLQSRRSGVLALVALDQLFDPCRRNIQPQIRKVRRTPAMGEAKWKAFQAERTASMKTQRSETTPGTKSSSDWQCKVWGRKNTWSQGCRGDLGTDPARPSSMLLGVWILFSKVNAKLSMG